MKEAKFVPQFLRRQSNGNVNIIGGQAMHGEAFDDAQGHRFILLFGEGTLDFVLQHGGAFHRRLHLGDCPESRFIHQMGPEAIRAQNAGFVLRNAFGSQRFDGAGKHLQNTPLLHDGHFLEGVNVIRMNRE